MSEITDKLRHLVSLDKPKSGGPYGGYAAAQCVKAMAEAADYIDRLEARVAELDRTVDFVTRWAWRDGSHLSDEERLGCIKFYPPIKARALTPVAETPNREPAP